VVPDHRNVHPDMHAISMFHQHRVSNLLLPLERLNHLKNFARIPCRICPANLPIQYTPDKSADKRNHCQNLSATQQAITHARVKHLDVHIHIFPLSVCLSVCFTCVFLCVASCMFHAFHVLLLWAKLPELNVMMMMMIANCGTLCRF